VVAEHVARNERTLLVLDEVDKIFSNNSDSWQTYLRSELYDLLDGRWPNGLREVKDENDNEIPIAKLTEKLKNNVFVLSIGTFQNWFDTAHSRQSIGFGDGSDPATEEITAEWIAGMMPRELANRHNSSIVRMPELTAEDYRHISQETADKLPQNLREPFWQEVEKRIGPALAAKKGFRYLEEAMMAALLTLPYEPPKPTIKTLEPTKKTGFGVCSP